MMPNRPVSQPETYAYVNTSFSVDTSLVYTTIRPERKVEMCERALDVAFKEFEDFKANYSLQTVFEVDLKTIYCIKTNPDNNGIVLSQNSLIQDLVSPVINIAKFMLCASTTFKWTEEQVAQTMGQQFVQKWTCPISLELMKIPVLLQCGHIFNREHIEKYIRSRSHCPYCRRCYCTENSPLDYMSIQEQYFFDLACKMPRDDQY